MLYVFYGSDERAAQAKWRALATAFQTKQPDGIIFRFEAETFLPEQFVELISATDLFGEKRLILGRGLQEEATVAELVSKHWEALATSPNTFVFWERVLPVATVRQIKAAGGRAEEHVLKEKKSSDFNPFALGDAILARDRKRAWLLFQEALRQGWSTEDVFWKLVWPVKAMLVVAKERGPLASLKPFVVAKARRGLAKFSVVELEDLLSRLIHLWHVARRGQLDFDLGLERLLLEL